MKMCLGDVQNSLFLLVLVVALVVCMCVCVELLNGKG